MGQYKVPQNVEAEDKIIGPLTFKQFVYALIGLGWALVCFAVFRTLIPVMLVIGGPPTMLFLLLAFYNRDGQNFEQLLIAMVGFFANSRKRVWRKDAVVESFHIEPRKVVKEEQSQRNPAEVRSELDRLAGMIDSRGWNQAPADTSTVIMPESDRLVTPVATPEAAAAEPKPSEDILDLQNSPLAQNLGNLLQEAAADVREEAIEQMKARTAHRAAAAAAPAPSISGVTTPAPNDILKLATERDDLTVSQLAATATRIVPMQEGQSVDLRSNGNTAN